MTRYWCNTVSLDHVLGAVAGGFTQAGHGRSSGLRHLDRGDGLVFYSPRAALGSGDPVQQFTGLGTVADDEPYQAQQTPDFRPWRRRVDFEEVGRADVRPLLADLSFITNEKNWGLPFRRGLFEIPEPDFALIAAAMRANPRT